MKRWWACLPITGPRQVGKTSLLEHLREPGRTCVTLDDMNLRALAKNDPPLFLQRFPPPVLIDEVQYAPELFPAIKQVADRKPIPAHRGAPTGNGAVLSLCPDQLPLGPTDANLPIGWL
jgi:predicted AAA+ superfamily ATPase